MTKLISILIISLFLCFGSLAKTLDQKKIDLKKIYDEGGITSAEYNKAQEYLDNSGQEIKKKKSKQTLNLTKKKKSQIKLFKKEKDKDKEEITLEKIEELGQIINFDNIYFTDGMIKKFKGCNNSFKCKGQKAGQYMSITFNKSKEYGQRNPGQMIKAMAMFEVFYASKLWQARKSIERYKKNNLKKVSQKQKDEKEIRSLLGMNKGRKGMREALGMNMETPSKEAIKKFWLLGEFLELGTGVKNEKLDKDLKERQELLEDYKLQIANLKKKLQKDKDKEENEKSFE